MFTQRIQRKHKQNIMNDFTLPVMLVLTFPELQKTCLCRHVFLK